MKDKVIVTVRTKEGYTADWELPGNVPVAELLAPCASALHRVAPGVYAEDDVLSLLCGGAALEPEESLLRQGVYTGSIIEIRRR